MEKVKGSCKSSISFVSQLIEATNKPKNNIIPRFIIHSARGKSRETERETERGLSPADEGEVMWGRAGLVWCV